MKKAAVLVAIAALFLLSAHVTSGMPQTGTLAAAGIATFQQGVNGYTGNTNAILNYLWKPHDNASSPLGVIALRTYQFNGITRFDVSSLPTDAYVTGATLRIYVQDRTNSGAITLNLYRLLRPWTLNQVTWHVASTGNDWEKPGASDAYIDHAEPPLASVPVSDSAVYYDIDMTDAVRDWVHNPASNFGALLVAAGTVSVQYTMGGDAYYVIEKRPRLTVSYSIDSANNFPPVVAITNPRHQSFVTGVVQLAADVQDDKGIQSLKYILDGAYLTQTNTAPFTYALDTATLAIGRHRLAARVTDNAGFVRDHAIIFYVYRMDNGIITFSHISDAHLGTQWEGDPPDPSVHTRRFQQAIAELNDVVQPAVIINTGDTTNVGDAYSWSIYTDAIAATKIPVMAVPGNHDQADDELYLSTVGKMKYSFDIGQNRFIAYTSKKLDVPWLNNLLATTDKKGILFAHFLLRLPQTSTSPAWFYVMPSNEVTALQQAKTTYGVSAYLSGHYHQPFVLQDKTSGLVEIGAPALGYKGSYLIGASDNGNVSTILHYLGDWPETIITSPRQFYNDGGSDTLSGTVAIRVKAYDAAPITSMTYAIDGVAKGPLVGLGNNVWQAAWDTTSLAFGKHTITATARDSLGRSRSTTITVKTVSATPEIPTATATPTATPDPATYQVRVNAGGQNYVDVQGNLWLADKAFSTRSWGYNGGSTFSTSAAIANTDNDPLYQSEHWGMSNYSFSVPNGAYEVELHFSEIYYLSAGSRIFDVAIENGTVLSAFDICAVTAKNSAYVRTFTTTVSDGVLNVKFTARKDSPKINAIRVTALGAPAATATSAAISTPSTPTATATATVGAPLDATATRTPTATEAWTTTPTFTATTVSGSTATPTATRSTAPGYETRVNAGGAAYVDTQGQVWQADQAYTSGGWGYSGGSVYATGATIGNTSDSRLYQSEHWGMTSYKFSVPNGTYEVALHFAEIFCSGSNCRVFSVALGNVPVLTDLDLYKVAGRNKAYVRTVTTAVSDGVLSINFTARTSSAKISAIRVTLLDASPTTPTPTATSTAVPTPYLMRVNCGGAGYVAGNGDQWSADQPFAEGRWGYDGATAGAGITTNAIAATTDPALYQTDRRWLNSEINPRYRFTVPNGQYDVTLHFAETDGVQAGQRVFTIKVGGVFFSTSYDIVAEAGAGNTAISVTVPVTISAGSLNIALRPVTGEPKVNSIEVKQVR